MPEYTLDSASPKVIPRTTEYEIDPETGAVLIPLGGKKWPDRCALVDPQDAERVAAHKWRAFRPCPRGDRLILYAGARMGKTFPYMHRFILGLTDPRVKVDHINHDGLDNRRCNLRIGTHQQNVFNRRPNKNASSRFKGVSWDSQNKRWRAGIKFNGRLHYLGLFADEVEAASVYDGAALTLFGSRAYLNFPDEVA